MNFSFSGDWLALFLMIPEAEGKPESRENDPEQLARLLEIQLAQKRAEWKSSGERYRKIRTAGLILLFLLVIGSLAAFFLLMTQLNEARQTPPGSDNPATSASP